VRGNVSKLCSNSVSLRYSGEEICANNAGRNVQKKGETGKPGNSRASHLPVPEL